MPPFMRRATLATAAVIALALSAAATAQQLIEFADAELFFELNDTDGDLGIHSSIDGEPWTALVIRGPRGSNADRRTPVRGRDDDDDDDDDGDDGRNGSDRLLEVITRGTLRTQGLTELSFESAEPPFDELAPADFFRRFPEGRYEIVARRKGGGRLVGEAELSHVLAAPPGNVLVNGIPAAASCDDPLPSVIAPVMIDWDPVTGSHPTIGRRGPVVIDQYQFFVEHETITLGVDLSREVTEFEVPTAVTRAGGEFKFEIIARTESGNNTAVESCFIVFQ